MLLFPLVLVGECLKDDQHMVERKRRLEVLLKGAELEGVFDALSLENLGSHLCDFRLPILPTQLLREFIYSCFAIPHFIIPQH